MSSGQQGPDAGIRPWQRALYAQDEAALAAGGRPSEDPRSADWIYLVPLQRSSTALLIDPKTAALARALARLCTSVTIAVSTMEQAATLSERLSGASGSLRFLVTRIGARLPLRDAAFDLVVIAGSRDEPHDALREAHRVLGPRGLLAMTVDNAFGLDRLLGRRRSTRGMSLRRWQAELRRTQFAFISVHAPLPSTTGAPLFLIPADAAGALMYFSRHLLPLIDAVSPEVKRTYKLERLAARLAAPLLQVRLIAALIAHFLPGYIVVARRIEQQGDHPSATTDSAGPAMRGLPHS